jgi:hypothetical protein
LVSEASVSFNHPALFKVTTATEIDKLSFIPVAPGETYIALRKATEFEM